MKPGHFRQLLPGNKPCQNLVAERNNRWILLIVWADRPRLLLSLGLLLGLHLAGGSARPGFCCTGCSRSALSLARPVSVDSPAWASDMQLRWAPRAAQELGKAPDVWAPERTQICHMHGSEQVMSQPRSRGGEINFTSGWSHISKGCVCPGRRGIGAIHYKLPH